MAEGKDQEQFKIAGATTSGPASGPRSFEPVKTATESAPREFVPASTAPQPQDKPAAAGSPASSGSNHAPHVAIKAGDTPVAIIGFSGSGKTVYLTMLYYATQVASNFREGWEANWVEMDDGATYSYLNHIYRMILGLNPDGSVRFDKTRRKVLREVPGGTTTQALLQFSMTRSTGVGDQILKIVTLDGAGEVLHKYASNPEIFSGADKSPEKASHPDWIQYGKRWDQLYTLCQASGAIMLFFSLLKSRDYDYTAEVRTLVDVLLKQKKKPEAVVFVVVGTDVLLDDNEVEAERAKIIERYRASTKRLDSTGVHWEVFMVSNFGRGFTRKKDPEFLLDECKNHHRCARCQELTGDPEARPQPVNLAEPWEFVYEHVFRRNTGLMIWDAIAAWGREYLLSKAALAAVVLIPLAFFGWVLASGWQHARQVDSLLTGELTPAKITEAIQLDQALTSNSIHRAVFPPEGGGPASPRAQLHRMAEAALVYDNPKLPAAARLAAAEAVFTQLQPSFQTQVPLAKLRLAGELEQILGAPGGDTGGKADGRPASPEFFAEAAKRVQAANLALSVTDRPGTGDHDNIEKATVSLLNDLGAQIDKLMKWLDAMAHSQSPQLDLEARRLAAVQDLQTALDKGAVRQMPAAQPVINRMSALLNELRISADFARVAALPVKTDAEVLEKKRGLNGFAQLNRDHALKTIAVLMAVQLDSKGREQLAANVFSKLPDYDSSALKDFTSFVKAYRSNAAFLQDYPQSLSYASRVTNRLQKWNEDLARSDISPLHELRQRTTKALLDLRLADLNPGKTMEAWEAEQRTSAGDLAALKDLTQFPLAGDTKDADKEQVRKLAADLVRSLAPELLKDLTELAELQQGFVELSRLLLASADNETAIDAKNKSLDQFIRRLPAASPVAKAASRAQEGGEDELLRRRLSTQLGGLATPDQASLATTTEAFESALESYRRLIDGNTALLKSVPGREQRYRNYLQAGNLSDPLRDAMRNRDLIQQKFEEKRAWEEVDKAVRGQSDPAKKPALLAQIDQFLQKYPLSEKAGEVRIKRQEVDNWRTREIRLALDDRLFGFKDRTPHKLTLTIRTAAGILTPLFKREYAVDRGRLVEPVDKTVAYNWNTGQNLVAEVRVVNAAGAEVYRAEKEAPAERMLDEITSAFPFNGLLNFKLKPL